MLGRRCCVRVTKHLIARQKFPPLCVCEVFDQVRSLVPCACAHTEAEGPRRSALTPLNRRVLPLVRLATQPLSVSGVPLGLSFVLCPMVAQAGGLDRYRSDYIQWHRQGVRQVPVRLWWHRRCGVRQVPVRLWWPGGVGLGRYRSDYDGTGGGVRQVPVRCMGSPHPCCSFGSKDRTHPRHKRSTGRGVGVGAALRVSRPRPPSHSSPGRKGRVPGVTQDLPGAAPFCKSRDRNDRSGDCRKLPPLGSEPAQAAGAPLRGLREPDSLPCAAHLALLCAEPSTRDFV
uniref:Unnamed protein product n=1 Tax=Macaca fascicularis TaxID=9541 RepID=Q9N045_MACFA|nr:unnamed protein product [Macaca fascicularis]